MPTATSTGFAYQQPQLTVTAQGLAAQQISTGPAPVTIALYGEAPQGPDVMTLINQSQFNSVYGNPGLSASAGYNLSQIAYWMGQQVGPFTIQYAVGRNGVVRASAAVQDTTAVTTLTAFTLVGVGAYAGKTVGGNLGYTIAIDGTRTKVSNISFYDKVSGAVVQSLTDVNNGGTFDLSSNARIVAAINGANPLNNLASVVNASVGNPSALTPAAQTTVLYLNTAGTTTVVGSVAGGNGTAASDGKGAGFGYSGGGSQIGTDGSGGLLDQSLAFPQISLEIYGYDANTVATTILTHLSTCFTKNLFRHAILGPAQGTPYGTGAGGLLSSGYLASISSKNISVVGHDTFQGLDPVTGSLTSFDGLHLAAMHAANAGMNVPSTTLAGGALQGVRALTVPTDLANNANGVNLTTLGQAGYMTLAQPGGLGSAVVVNDQLTTAPISVGGAQNYYAYQNIVRADNAFSTVVWNALQPFKNQASIPFNQLQPLLQAAITAAVGKNLLKGTINGINGVTVSQNSNGQIVVAPSYKARPPITNISIPTSFTLQ